MEMTTTDRVHAALDGFRIELPSWGFANTGTRFGKFLQPAAASTLEEKFCDAGQVHALTGVCPTVALHVLWDLPEGIASAAEIARLSARYGVGYVSTDDLRLPYLDDRLHLTERGHQGFGAAVAERIAGITA
jgi:L-rhamnose isomerase